MNKKPLFFEKIKKPGVDMLFYNSILHVCKCQQYIWFVFEKSCLGFISLHCQLQLNIGTYWDEKFKKIVKFPNGIINFGSLCKGFFGVWIMFGCIHYIYDAFTKIVFII